MSTGTIIIGIIVLIIIALLVWYTVTHWGK